MLKVQDYLPEEYKKKNSAFSNAATLDTDSQSTSSDISLPSSKKNSKKQKYIIPIIFASFLVIGSGISMYLLRQNQDIRQQASVDGGVGSDNCGPGDPYCGVQTTGNVCTKTEGCNVWISE